MIVTEPTDRRSGRPATRPWRGPLVSRFSPLAPWLGLLARWGLAAVWLLAGSAKVGDLAASGRAVHAYRVFPYEVSMTVGTILPFVEIALGVLLLVGLATRPAAGFSAFLLVVFVTGIISAWARGLAIDCGCFGDGGELAAGQDPRYGPELIRDLGFLALAGILLVFPRTPVSLDRWLWAEPGEGGEAGDG